MGLTIMTLKDGSGSTGQYELPETLWLAPDMVTVVKDGDPSARSLIGRKGKMIPMARAKELGIVDDDPEYYEDMKVDRLKELLTERGLDTSGKKDELIARLVEDDEASEE